MMRTEKPSPLDPLTAGLVTDFVREPLLILDLALRVVSANPSYFQFFRVTREEVEGKPIGEIWNAGDVVDRLRKVAKDQCDDRGEEFEVDREIDRIGPRRLKFKVKKICPPDKADGSLIFVSIDDETWRARDEKKLSEYEGRLRLIFESVKDFSIFTTDLSGTIDTWNAGAENVFGYEESEILGKPYSTIFTPEDRAIGADDLELKNAAEQGRALDERWHLKKDGSRFFASGMVTPLLNDADQLIGFTKVARDITPRRRAEEALRRSEEFSRKIVDNSPDCMKVLDLDGKLISINEVGCKLLEIDDPASLIDKPIDQIWPEDVRPKVASAIEAAREGKTTRFEGECPTLRGAPKTWDVAVIPIVGPDNQVERVLSVSRDVTNSKRAERLLEEQAQALREADRRKDEFLAMLAHELRNPLAAIAGSVTLMHRGKDAEEDIAWGRDVIDRQVMQLTRLIDDLLDVSRISTGKIELKATTIDLRDVIADAVESLRPAFASKNHRLIVDLPDQPLPVEGDGSRLQQAVGNLLNNSAKYTDPNGRIEIRARAEGDRILVRVVDNGVGISAEMLPSIFGLFAQVDSSAGRSQGGLGIGLSLVKKLVEMHGGSVSARSEGLGEGSELRVELPMATRSKGIQPGGHAPERTPASSRSIGKGSPRRILIVDDNEDTSRVMARILKRAGHETRTAADGPSALDAASTFRPEVILLDIGLPGMTGHEVAQALRRLPCVDGALIVAVSGYGQEKDRDEAIASGFDDHMLKPIDSDKLLERISHHRLSGEGGGT